jgi:hypothetical protein
VWEAILRHQIHAFLSVSENITTCKVSFEDAMNKMLSDVDLDDVILENPGETGVILSFQVYKMIIAFSITYNKMYLQVRSTSNLSCKILRTCKTVSFLSAETADKKEETSRTAMDLNFI